MTLRVLLVHNRYQEQGGEDAVFEAEGRLLEEHGHTVGRVVFDNDAIPDRRSALTAARLAAETVWSRRAAARVGAAVRTFRPDIAHFHNTFPLISPSAYAACKAEQVAVVQTLHNYRLVCPSANLFRDGRPCEDCLGRTPPWPGVLHACYRDSRPQTAVVAGMVTAHRLRRTWRRDVDRLIVPAEFARAKLIAGGLDAARLVVKPNFVAPDPGASDVTGDAVLFVGRLVETKGVAPLLRAWTEHGATAPLRIAGTGPLAPAVRRAAAECPRITYLGHLSPEDVRAEMRAARAVIVPSVWYETFGLTIAEAFACGRPVIASRLGVMAELVTDGRTGLLFRAGDAAGLAATVDRAWRHPEDLARMGVAARCEYEATYTGERNYQQLIEIYEQVLAESGGCRRDGG